MGYDEVYAKGYADGVFGGLFWGIVLTILTIGSAYIIAKLIIGG